MEGALIRKMFGAALLAAFALSACGNSVDAEGAATDAGGVSEQSASTPMEADAIAGLIPAAFQGSWDMKASDACSGKTRLTTIGANSIRFWGGDESKVVEAKLLEDDVIEGKFAQDPAYPDADQRFGLALSGGGDEMTFSAPGSSPTNFVRCTANGAAAKPAVAAKSGELPKAMLGYWDIRGEVSCSDLSTDGMQVLPRKLQYYEGHSALSNIERIGDRTYRMKSRYHDFDGPTDTISTMTLELSKDGGKLIMQVEGFDEFVYDERCASAP